MDLIILCVLLLAVILQQYITLTKQSGETMATSSNKKYTQDGDEAKEIAQYLPYFPFKGIPRFYDIGAFLYGACVTQLFLAGTFIFIFFV